MKIFVSSTYEDLKKEREAILSLSMKLKATFVGMEIFPAAVITPKETALQEIADCDVAVFIIAHRYGAIDLATNKSIVELEYEAAYSNHKEVLVYFKDENTPIRLDQIDFENRGKLDKFKMTLDTRHHYHKFSSPHELAALVTIELVDRFLKRGWWIGVSRETFVRYRKFWNQTLTAPDTVLILEVGKYAAHKGELELAKNIHGVMGTSKLIPVLTHLGVDLKVEAATPGIPLNRNLILDGSHTGNSITRRAIETPELTNKLIYKNEHSDDLFTRWLQNVYDSNDLFKTKYVKGESFVAGAPQKRVSYDYGFLARVKNPFGPSGNCIIASGNHGAGTYGCMRVLSSPDFLESIIKQVEDREFQAVIGIETGELFRLGDPVIHKVVCLDS